MRRKSKKYVSIIIAMTMFTCGCGTPMSKGKTTSGNIDKKVYTIGEIVSLTGEYEQCGQNVNKGVIAAVDEINAAGGINVGGINYELKLVTAEDESSPDMAKNAYNTLKDKDVEAIISPVSEAALKAIEQTANQDNMPLYVTSVTSDGTADYDNEFRICLSDEQMGKEIARYAHDVMNKNSVAVLYEERYNPVVEAFLTEFQSLGGTALAREMYAQGQEDLSVQLDDIKSASPDVVFVPGNKDEAISLIQLINGLGVETSIVGDSSWNGIAIQPDELINISDMAYLDELPLSNAFMEKYGVKYGINMSKDAGYGYDAVYLIKNALEEAESVDEDLLICAMNQMDVDGVTGYEISYSDSSQNQKKVTFNILKNSDVVNVEE